MPNAQQAQDLGARAGGRAFLHYGHQGEPYHERLLGAHLGGSRWVVVTPTLDIYDEDIDEAVECIFGGDFGGLPRALHGKRLFRFDGLDAADRTAFMQQCADYAQRHHAD